MRGADGSTHLTNMGLIHITGDDTLGIIARLGNGHHVSNFGQIETEGTFALGIATSGRDNEIVNAGQLSTEGDLALGVTVGLTRIGFVPAADGAIVNRGVIETDGDGAPGVVMIGDGHHLTNSGRITTNGGVFDGEPVGLFRAAGVVVSGDEALVLNTRTGVIASENADSAAVELNVLERDGLSNTDTSSTLENFGRMDGAIVSSAVTAEST